MSVEVQPQQAPTPEQLREQWIQDRVAEFEANPANRDRAIATILFDSMMLNQSIGQMMGVVQKEGIGGLVKAVMTGGRSNGKG